MVIFILGDIILRLVCLRYSSSTMRCGTGAELLKMEQACDAPPFYRVDEVSSSSDVTVTQRHSTFVVHSIHCVRECLTADWLFVPRRVFPCIKGFYVLLDRIRIPSYQMTFHGCTACAQGTMGFLWPALTAQDGVIVDLDFNDRLSLLHKTTYRTLACGGEEFIGKDLQNFRPDTGSYIWSIPAYCDILISPDSS